MRLKVLLRRVGCRDCGKRMEAVSWLDRHARMTRRLAVAVIKPVNVFPRYTWRRCSDCIGTPFGCYNVKPCKRH